MNAMVTAVGVFEDRSHAEYAVEELHRNGFTPDQIGILIPDAAAKVQPPPHSSETKVEEGAATGAVAGAAVGGVVGAVLAGLVIPGVGPVIAGGLMVGILSGAVTGLAGGGIVGALIGLEIPEEEARGYEREFHSGRTLVTVRAGSRYEEATAILRRVAEAPLSRGHVAGHGNLARLTQTEGDAAPGAGTIGAPRP